MSLSDDAPLVGIVIASHGDLAQALKRSAEMIAGEQDGIVTVGLAPQDNLDSLQDTFRAAIEQADCGSGVIVFIDLFGGTPANAAARCAVERDAPAVSGVNLPMLLEVLMSRHASTPAELAALAVDSGAQGIVNITARLKAATATR